MTSAATTRYKIHYFGWNRPEPFVPYLCFATHEAAEQEAKARVSSDSTIRRYAVVPFAFTSEQPYGT